MKEKIMQRLGFSEEMLNALEEIEDSMRHPDEEREERSFEEEQKLQGALSEGDWGQESYDPKDDIGRSCGFLECVRNGDEAIL